MSPRAFISTALLLACLPTAQAVAQRPAAARLLPDQTVAYLRIANVPEFADKFSQTSVGRAVNDPQMQPFVSGIWQTIKQSLSQFETEAETTVEALLQIPQGELAAGLIAMEEGNPALLVLCQLGEDKRTVEKLLEVMEAAARNDGTAVERSNFKEAEIVLFRGDDTVAVSIHDQTLLVSNRIEAIEDALEHWGGDREDSIASDNRFTTIISSSRGTNDEPAQLTWYVNPIETLRTFTRGNAGGGYIMAFMPVLGLDGLKAIGGSQILATDDFDSISHLHVMLERPRTGVIEMIAFENASTQPEPWVPEGVTTYTTANWNVEKSFHALEKLYDGIVGDGKLAEDIDRRINQRAMIDFKTEVIDNLDGRFTLIQWYEPPARINSQATFIAARVKDPVAMQRTLDRVVDSLPRLKENMERRRFGEASFYQSSFGNEPIPEEESDEQRRRRERRGQFRPQPCFGVVGDYVFFADRPGIVEHVAMTQGGDLPRLADDLSFKLVINKLQQHAHERKIGMISFNRPDEELRWLFELAKAESTRTFVGRLAEDNPFFRNLQGNLDTNPLPDFEAISQYLAPSGSILVDDETGLHIVGFQLKRQRGADSVEP